jgi:NADH-quinone oxidoreductase subunit J
MIIPIQEIIFYTLSTVAIVSALMVVSSKNTVRGVLFLVLTFFCMAGLWLLLRAEFLALVLVLVYVGAVMTLFLFVVMMLNIDRLGSREGFVRYLPLGLIVILSIVSLIVMVVGPGRFGLLQMPLPAPEALNYSNTESLGDLLYTHYAYPFEVAAVLLLTAIIAAISLAHRVIKPHKTQRISAQVGVRAKDRLRIVNMPSESKLGEEK